MWQHVSEGLRPVQEARAVPAAVPTRRPARRLCRVWPKLAGARSAGLGPIAGHYDPSRQDHSLLRAGHLAEKRNSRSEPRYHGRKRVSEPGRGQRASERSCSPQRVRVSLRTCVREGAGGRSRPPLVTRSARWPPAAVHAPSPRCTRDHSRLRSRCDARLPRLRCRRRDASPGHGS